MNEDFIRIIALIFRKSFLDLAVAILLLFASIYFLEIGIYSLALANAIFSGALLTTHMIACLLHIAVKAYKQEKEKQAKGKGEVNVTSQPKHDESHSEPSEPNQ